MLLLSINAIRGREDNPATRASTLTFGTFVIEGAAKAVKGL
jgi:hypothetical protein